MGHVGYVMNCESCGLYRLCGLYSVQAQLGHGRIAAVKLVRLIVGGALGVTLHRRHAKECPIGSRGVAVVLEGVVNEADAVEVTERGVSIHAAHLCGQHWGMSD